MFASAKLIHEKLPALLVAITILALASRVRASAEGKAGSAATGDSVDWNKAREFWAFRAPVARPRPEVRNRRWARQPLDYFILAAMERRGMSPSPEAEKRTLLRRVTFDLSGLPPTPEEMRSFLADERADAYETVVERLLASPRFGERMASPWLNVARYAEDQAHQVGTDVTMFYPNAWRYREWVIQAFNRDLPYDQFIQLQLAADQVEFKIQSSKFKIEETAASAGAGNPKPKTQNPEPPPSDLAALGFLGLGPKYYARDRLDVMADEWEDRVDTVTRSFLGLTVACARCHDHKYDPITMRDYYGLAGVFASTRMVNKTADGKVLPPPKSEKEAKEAPKMPADILHIVEDGKPQDLNVFLRGNVDRKGPLAGRAFLRVLCAAEPMAFAEGSGRKELAAAIAARTNPLTARVMVNRVWTLFFARGLVATASNFGSQGQRPTHPELLDDLAIRFMDGGWSVKTLVREMVLSSTYRQASQYSVSSNQVSFSVRRPARETTDHGSPNADDSKTDPSNDLLSHMNRRRMTVEMWRDAVLFVSGELEAAGGPSLELDDAKNHRRTVYARVSRLKLNDMLMQFDYPDANVHAEKRSVTSTATQKLFVLNSPFMLSRAKALAARLTANPQESDRARVERAYQLLYGRSATTVERELALAFLGQTGHSEMPRWEQYAQALLAANEMIYVD